MPLPVSVSSASEGAAHSATSDAVAPPRCSNPHPPPARESAPSAGAEVPPSSAVGALRRFELHSSNSASVAALSSCLARRVVAVASSSLRLERSGSSTAPAVNRRAPRPDTAVSRIRTCIASPCHALHTRPQLKSCAWDGNEGERTGEVGRGTGSAESGGSGSGEFVGSIRSRASEDPRVRARGRRGGTHQSAAVGTPRERLENGEEDALGEVVPSVEPLRGVARGLSAPTRATRATGRPVAHRIVRLRRLRVRVGQTTALARERIAVLRGVAGRVRDDGARARVGTRHLGAAWSARGGARESEVETCQRPRET